MDRLRVIGLLLGSGTLVGVGLLGCQPKFKGKVPVAVSETTSTENKAAETPASKTGTSAPSKSVFTPVEPEDIQGKILERPYLYAQVNGSIDIFEDTIIAAHRDNRGAVEEPGFDEIRNPLVYVANIYRYDGQDWALEDRLALPTKSYSEEKEHVAIHEDVAMVTSINQAFLFRRQGDQWHQEFRIGTSAQDQFDLAGCSLTKNRVACSTSPSFYSPQPEGVRIYKYQEQQWTLEQKLIPAPPPDPSKPTQYFGQRLDLGENMVVLSGLIGGEAGQPDTGDGLVYAYRLKEGIWKLDQEITSIDTKRFPPHPWFGRSLALSEDTLLIGETADHVYVFSNDQDQWKFVGTLEFPPPEQRMKNDVFGTQVSVYQNYALVGVQVGAAYLYVRQADNTWVFHKTLNPTQAVIPQAAGVGFGSFLSLSNYGAVVGGGLLSTVFWPLSLQP